MWRKLPSAAATIGQPSSIPCFSTALNAASPRFASPSMYVSISSYTISRGNPTTAAPGVVLVLEPSATLDKRLCRWSRNEDAGWVMCKLTKTDSAVLSWYLEIQYVNEVTARGYAVAPNLDVPLPSRSKLTH